MSKQLATFQAMVIISSILLVSVSASGQSNETIVDSNVTWEDSGGYSCDGTIRVMDGGILTIKDTLVDLSCDIIVNEGGILHLDNSDIYCSGSDDFDWDAEIASCPLGMMGYGFWDEENRSSFKVPNEGISGDFSVTIHSVDGASFYGSQAFVDDSDPISLNGSQHTFEFSDVDNEQIWISFIGYGQSPITIAYLTVEAGNSVSKFGAPILQKRNMMGAGSQEYEIVVDGLMEMVDSTLFGAKVTIGDYGSLVTYGSHFDSVGPILSQGDGSVVRIVNTSFQNSLDDHDVRGTAFSEISWENSSGSGGFTDRWERRIVDQKVVFDSRGVVFRVNGIGVSESTSFESFSDDSGESLVNGGGERVVEVGWSNGTIWSESATIEIISYRTGWNPDGSGIDDYGGYNIPLSWHDFQYVSDSTPHVEWSDLEFVLEEDVFEPVGYAGSSVPMRASFTNTGTASASFYISCEIVETGMDADIGGFQGLVLNAGQTAEMLFDWRGGETGDYSLDCEILTPTQLVLEDSFGGGKLTSGTVSWVESVDDEGLPMGSILVALTVAVLIIGVWFVRKSSEEDYIED